MVTRLPKILTLCFFLFVAACTVSTQVTNTQRSTIEQRLLVRSLERALATIHTQLFQGKTVAVEFYGLTPDKDFAKEFFIAWLQGHHVQIVADPKKAEFRLKVFASALGVDQGQAFLGIPAITVPIVAVGVPEIALFKSVQHRGNTELQIYTLDGRTGKFIDKSPPAIGEATYDAYTFLIFINFSTNDLDQPDGY